MRSSRSFIYNEISERRAHKQLFSYRVTIIIITRVRNKNTRARQKKYENKRISFRNYATTFDEWNERTKTRKEK